MKVIEKNGTVLARHITEQDWKEGLNFFSEDVEFIQVGTWNYNAGKELKVHVHNKVIRQIEKTYEVLYIKNGSIMVRIYTNEKELLDEFKVKSGEILILLECGHGYTILEDDTKVIEIKNGPYMGAETDRTRIECV